MTDVALWDLVAPYFLLGNPSASAHAALAAIAVDEYEEATDATAAVLRGIARIRGEVEVTLDTQSMTFGVRATTTLGHPLDDPSRHSPWIDLRDTTIEFQLLAPRVASQIVLQGQAPIGATPAAAFAPTDAVLDVLAAPNPPADYPSSEFVLDLVVTSAVLRPPFLHPAEVREDDGVLIPHASATEVALALPKIKLQITQGTAIGSQPQVRVLSFGASGLDDPGDVGVAQMVTMDPPHAFIGPGQVVGFGFRSAVLDLSNASTPPAVLEQFGFDASWTGVYFPEIRLFVSPQGAKGWAVNGGAENLLVGLGASSGVTGDFSLDVVNQGSDVELRLGARFYTALGAPIAMRRTSATTATVVLPRSSRMVVDVEGGRPPYITQVKAGKAKTFTSAGPSVDIEMIDATQTIDLTASEQIAKGKTAALTIFAQFGNAGGGSGSITTTIAGRPPAATVVTTKMTRNGVKASNPRIVIDSQTDSAVTVRLEDNAVARWVVDGKPGAAAARTVTFPLAAASDVTVDAEVDGVATKAPIYFHYAEPDQMSDTKLDAYALNPNLTRSAESADETIDHGWTGGVPAISCAEYASALRSIPAGTKVVVDGHASFDGDDHKAAYNLLLSERRAKVARRIYEELTGPGANLVFEVAPQGFTFAKQDPTSPRRHWWRVELHDVVNSGQSNISGVVARGPIPTTKVVTPVADPPPPAPERPDFLRSIGAKVRIIRDDFVAVELHGEIDAETAAEKALRVGGPGPSLKTPSAGDGIVAFRAVFTRNPGSDEWSLDLTFGADPTDLDGLWMTGVAAGQPVPIDHDVGRDLLGLYALFFPLLAKAVPEQMTGSIADIGVVSVVIPLALQKTGWFKVHRVIWFGGEVIVRQHDGDWSTTILADVETALSADVELFGKTLLTIDPARPLVARYKAIGVRFGADANGKASFHPVFDSSKGYTLDVARPGSLKVADPFGQLLRVDGVKISKTNPTMLEVQLGSAVDLGVVALERCGVRVTLAETPSVELTDLGARVNVPGVIAGSGYLAFEQDGIAGRIDLTLVPLRLRIAASLRIANIEPAAGGPATGVAIAIEVDFPVAIPLWSSGLGLYGLIGLFAMHFSRNETKEIKSGSDIKALDWLTRAGGDPTHVENPELWKPEIDHWAFGVGALVGTMGSSIVFNMKGLFMLELPGPRLLLMMKANLLSPMPAQKTEATGTLLAVIDVDAARETVTIGIVVDYSIEPLLALRIPVEAFFDGKDAKNWHVYLGDSVDPIRAKILGVFDGSGYLMLAGDGATADKFPATLPRPAGFAIAAGLHVSMVWGSKEAKVYAELAAGFDAVLGFSPLLVAGIIVARGELRLFVISISATATLGVRLGELPDGPKDAQGKSTAGGYEIHGEVCGKVDLLLFEAEACVDFTISDGTTPGIAVPALVNAVALVGRSPALVQGSGTGAPIDASIGDAIASGDEPDWGSLPKELWAIRDVPLDIVPVVMCSAPPLTHDAATDTELMFGALLTGGASGGRTVERSSDRLTYTMTAVELKGDTAAGLKPATWWTQRPPDEANETSQLALLSWTPNATPKAFMASEALDETVKDRWGTVCHGAAPPTPVLWTFRFEPLGRSVPGWSVDGEAWPDPPETVRSAPTPTVLAVHERWRCGDPMVDPFRGILPAEVVGALVACSHAPAPGKRPAPQEPARRAVSAGQHMLGAKRPETIFEPAIDFAEMTRRLRIGQPIARASLMHVTADRARSMTRGMQPGTGVPATMTSGSRCASRLLAAPRFDDLAPPTADKRRAVDTLAAWEALAFDPGDLADAVSLAPGAFDRARVLLFVPRRLLRDKRVHVRAVTPAGKVLSKIAVDLSHEVVWATLPTTWVDPAGPWDDDISLVMNHLPLFAKDDYRAVLVDVDGGLQADRVLVGIAGDEKGSLVDASLPGPAYYVAACEALRATEVSRSDFDAHEAAKNHAVLEAALADDSGFVPLLMPDTAYNVVVTWTASASNATASEHKFPPPQSFWFRTTDKAPDRLDPWVLACSPYEDERHVFGGEPLQISFATQDVVEQFAAFGYRLEIRLIAASSLHPDPAALPIDYPPVIESVLPGSAVVSEQPLSSAVPGAVFSPWEDAVTALVNPACIDVDEQRTRHSVTKIPIPLHPSTDYLLDIWRVPVDNRPNRTEARVFRRAFATSQFASLAACASYCLGSRVIHRSVPDGLAAIVSSTFATHQPEGEQLDNVLRGAVEPPHAGIEPMPVPDQPRVIVWWEGAAGATPQPTAITIDATEPLWRSRDAARLVTLPNGGVQHWELARADWVWPEEAAGSGGVVQRIVRAPGGQRAIAILKPSSRGSFCELVLHRKAFTEPYLDGSAATDQLEPLAEVSLLNAPWEEI